MGLGLGVVVGVALVWLIGAIIYHIGWSRGFNACAKIYDERI